ncbi:hypothetical protein CMI37_31195 [Candidatus Pacearchaeota archaeon]|nr:hypothetical protein [Candidatus Pacearchaeota archaeon]
MFLKTQSGDLLNLDHVNFISVSHHPDDPDFTENTPYVVRAYMSGDGDEVIAAYPTHREASNLMDRLAQRSGLGTVYVDPPWQDVTEATIADG